MQQAASHLLSALSSLQHKSDYPEFWRNLWVFTKRIDTCWRYKYQKLAFSKGYLTFAVEIGCEVQSLDLGESTDVALRVNARSTVNKNPRYLNSGYLNTVGGTIFP